MTKPLRLLIVEGKDDDALLEVCELRKRGFDPDYQRVDTPQDLEAALEATHWDAIIADYNMPSFTGMDALRIVQTKGVDLPFLLVSGTVGEDRAVEAMKAGAHDYIMKGNLARLAPAMERELVEVQVRRERLQALEALQKAHDELENCVHERTAELMLTNAALQAEIVERQQVQEELQQANQLLEQRVAERTAELTMSVDALQQEVIGRELTQKALRDNERLLRTVLETMPVGVWVLDNRGQITYGNPAGRQIWGGAGNVGMDQFGEYKGWWHDSGERIKDDEWGGARAITKGESSIGEVVDIECFDGSRKTILRSAIPLMAAAGEVTGVIIVNEDISKLKQAEKQIIGLYRLYRVLSETNQSIVRLSDRDILFTEICRIAVDHGGFLMAWAGLVDDETGLVNPVAKAGLTEGYLDDIRISIREEPAGFGPAGTAIREGTHCICNDFLGDPRTAPWQAAAARSGFRASAAIALKLNHKVIGTLTFYAGEKDFFQPQLVELLQQMAADVSFALESLDLAARHKEAEHALQAETAERLRVLEELREKDSILMQQSRLAAMGEMIGNIAHQWRQPLNTLGLIIQQAPLYYELGQFNKEFLDNSVKKSMDLILHMSRTIDDFRNYFKPDKKKVEFKLHEAVVKSLSLIKDSFHQQQISIEVDAQNNPVIYGYENEFSQALLNILINARDALIEREVDDPRVMIHICTEDNKAVLTISDNAGGIHEEIMDKIFEPYFTTKGPQMGTGVGLFMSKAIVEKNMGGRLSMRNTCNGVEFRIEV